MILGGARDPCNATLLELSPLGPMLRHMLPRSFKNGLHGALERIVPAAVTKLSVSPPETVGRSIRGAARVETPYGVSRPDVLPA